MNIAANPSPVITSAEQSGKGITLTFSDGHSALFHNIWLRDCCYCDECGDSYSSKRYIVPSDLNLADRPVGVLVTETGGLAITWETGSHKSEYDGAWLRRHCYDDATRDARRHKPLLWDSTLTETLPEVDFAAAAETDEGRMQLYRNLRDYGFAIVRGGPKEPGSIAKVAGMIGQMGQSAYSEIFDLMPKSKTKTIGNSTRPVPPHTDEAFRHSPPGVNILSCVVPASDGGKTQLTDGFNLAERLRREDPESFEVLTTYSHRFHRLHEGTLHQQTNARMIALDDAGQVCGMRMHNRASGPMDLPGDVVEAYYKAHHRLSALMMESANQIRTQLYAGDTALFDNHRVLHARTDFTDMERHMQICNVSREDFHERLRLLAAKTGNQAEADQILSIGVAC